MIKHSIKAVTCNVASFLVLIEMLNHVYSQSYSKHQYLRSINLMLCHYNIYWNIMISWNLNTISNLLNFIIDTIKHRINQCMRLWPPLSTLEINFHQYKTPWTWGLACNNLIIIHIVGISNDQSGCFCRKYFDLQQGCQDVSILFDTYVCCTHQCDIINIQ